MSIDAETTAVVTHHRAAFLRRRDASHSGQLTFRNDLDVTFGGASVPDGVAETALVELRLERPVGPLLAAAQQIPWVSDPRARPLHTDPMEVSAWISQEDDRRPLAVLISHETSLNLADAGTISGRLQLGYELARVGLHPVQETLHALGISEGLYATLEF